MSCISVMLKPASSECNMNCSYCFYHDVAARRQCASCGFMSEKTALNVAEKTLSYAEGDDAYFVFQGGEPLLRGTDFFERFFKAVSKKSDKAHLSVQTNGTLLDGVWAKLFKAYDVLVGVSLDGEFSRNADRVYASGEPTFHRVISGIEALEREGVQFNIVSVLTSKNCAEVGRSFEFFKSKGWLWQQYIPCLNPTGAKGEAMTSKQYTEALKVLFKSYSRCANENRRVSVRQLDNYIRLAAGIGAEQCSMNGRCSGQLVIEGDGSVYPCDFYCTDEWLLGNINESTVRQLLGSERATAFLEKGDILKNLPPKKAEQCRRCNHLPLCRAQGCRRSIESSDYCEAYRAFFGAHERDFLKLK